jgi:hypothetical protein
MQEYKPTTIQLRSLVENTLTYHEEIAMQTLVVNLPSREMPNMPRKILPSTSAPHLKDEIPQLGRKNQISQESELCVIVKMREKLFNIYCIMTFN